MEERLLDSLGDYFVYHGILEKRGITFEQFINKWERGVLEL